MYLRSLRHGDLENSNLQQALCLHPVCKILLLQFVSCICFHRPAMNFTRNLQVISPVLKIGPKCIYFIYDKCLLFLRVSVDGGITVFTGSLFQCLIILAIRKLVLISSQNYPYCILNLCPLYYSHGEQTWVFYVSCWPYACMKVVVVFSFRLNMLICSFSQGIRG